jgi:hypothetical protein
MQSIEAHGLVSLKPAIERAAGNAKLSQGRPHGQIGPSTRRISSIFSDALRLA